MTHAWQQRVVRLYDPDWHMIEVGESMGAHRTSPAGRGPFRGRRPPRLIHHPTDFVEQWQKGFEIELIVRL